MKSKYRMIKLKDNQILNTIKATYSMPLLFNTEGKNRFTDDDILSRLSYQSFNVYGSPSFKWNSGRTGETNITFQYIEDRIKYFNSLNIPCFTTFTNYHLTKQDLRDELGNTILDILSTSNINGVIVSNEDIYIYPA